MSEGRRYKVLGVLGKGGFGTVYKAELLGEGGFTRSVALKVLNADMREMEDVASRLRDEARLLGLLRHRAILGVDGLVRLNGRWTVVMEYIHGADLGRVTRTARFPLGVALEVVGEVASALHVAYTTPNPEGVPMRLLHRDIKPQNVLLTAAGEIKVLDFGIARAEFSNREAKTQSVLYGSVAYMAPERLDFEELHEGDVYALGVVLYELLTGEPFGKASIRGERHAKAVVAAAERVRAVIGSHPSDFIELLQSMLSYDPEERPNAREVERRCRALRSQLDDQPWLRDWSEMVIPEVLKGMDALGVDDFSNSVLVESQSVKVTNDLAFAVPHSDRSPPRRPGYWSGLALGGSLVGCLVVGVSVVLVCFLVVFMYLAESDAPDLDTAAPSNVPDWDDAEIVDMEEKEAPFDGEYGPPKGYSYRVKLGRPWSKMKLPIGKGSVTVSQSDSLVVMYGGGPIKPMIERWEKSFEDAGFEVTMMYDSDRACTRIVARKNLKYTVSTVPAQGNVLVSISQH